MWERFPPRMRKAVAAAIEEAGRAGREEVAPEHLLLAIAKDPEAAGTFVFEYAGVPPARVIESLKNALPKPAFGRPRALRFSSAALHVLDIAAGEADRLKHSHVGTEHIALALARVNSNLASQTLLQLGYTHDRADAATKAWFDQGMPRRRGRAIRALGALGIGRRLVPIAQKALRVPRLAWHVYIGRSLGHPRFVTDPYRLYTWLRRHAPIRKDPLAPVWVLTRYADVAAMLRDPRFRKDPFAADRLPPAVREQLEVTPDPSSRAILETISMLFLDPPEHTRVRGLFTRAFTPRSLEALRPRIQQITDKRLDRVEDQRRASSAATRGGTFDLIAELAVPLPLVVISELVGFPPENYPKIKTWSDAFAAALGLNPTPEQQLKASAARQAMREYFDRVVEDLRRHPRECLLNSLLQQSPPEALTHEELFVNTVLLLAAGHETTTHLIGNGVLALLRHPDQWRDLREHPELIGNSVEELLRYDPPVQWTSRVAGEDMEFAGKELKRGDILLGSVGGANRDERQFADPDRLNIRREDAKQHVSFGSGVHYCLGAALAKMEAEAAIGTLVRRFPNLRLAVNPKNLTWQKGLTFRGVKSLPLTA